MCSSSSRSPGIRTAFRPASSTAFLMTCTEQVLLVKSLISYCCTGGCSYSSITFRPDALQEALQVMHWLRGLPYLSVFMLREVRDCHISALSRICQRNSPANARVSSGHKGFLHGRPTQPWVLVRQAPPSCQLYKEMKRSSLPYVGMQEVRSRYVPRSASHTFPWRRPHPL